MRISVREGDDGFVPKNELRFYKILLDGVQQNYVLCADDKEGYLEKHALHSDGARLAVDEQGDFVILRVLGRIQIKLAAAPGASRAT